MLILERFSFSFFFLVSAKEGTEGVHGAPLGATDLANVKTKYGFNPEEVQRFSLSLILLLIFVVDAELRCA